jgi:hypothetical protein
VRSRVFVRYLRRRLGSTPLNVSSVLTLVVDSSIGSRAQTWWAWTPSVVPVQEISRGIVTVVAALVPAMRATKVLPIEALREAYPATAPRPHDASSSGPS